MGMKFNPLAFAGFSKTGSGSDSTKADTNLGNLTSPTAVNQHLLPETTNATNIGSASKYWLAHWIAAIKSPLSGQTAVEPFTHKLMDSAGGDAVQFYSTTEIDVFTKKIINLGTPTAAGHAATKGYVDGLIAPADPTIQKFTTGSGTYTTPANTKYIRVKMIGGGGGGGGSSNANDGGTGSDGTATTFGTNSAGAGSGGTTSWTNGGSAGGASSIGAGFIGTAVSGAAGSKAGLATTGSVFFPGATGGSSELGGAGTGGGANGNTGEAAATNSGSGGGGASHPSGGTNKDSGNGGGSGGYVEVFHTSPAATYSYVVGAGGAGGAAGTNGHAGGAGAAGYIIVEEYY